MCIIENKYNYGRHLVNLVLFHVSCADTFLFIKAALQFIFYIGVYNNMINMACGALFLNPRFVTRKRE